MEPTPHHYHASAAAVAEGDVELGSPGLPALMTQPPEEFGGPGDRWSPETLLAGAVADCFVLSFRAVAVASKLEWTRLLCNVEGTLDRVEKVTRFTHFKVHARLETPAGTDRAQAERALHKAESICLVSNSLTAEIELEPEVITA